MLAVFLTLQLGLPRLFEPVRFALFDRLERAFPRLQSDKSVVVVGIDEASLQRIGQWPWPRQRLASLVTEILAAHPAALGLDMLWPEPDQTSPAVWLEHAGPMPVELHDAVSALPSHDERLRDALAGGPVAIGLGGLDVAGGAGPLAPVREYGGIDKRRLPHFAGSERSLPRLDRAAAGHGLLSVRPDPDGVFRRLPTVSILGSIAAPSLDVELLRIAQNAPIRLYGGDGRVQGLKIGTVTLPTEADGSIWVDYAPPDARLLISAADVLAGTVDPARFNGHLVLVGPTALGLFDQRLTPIGLMGGTELQAQLLENVVMGRLAHRWRWSSWGEPALSAVMGLFLILTVPAVPRRWVGLLALLPLSLLVIAGVLAWRDQRVLIDIATPALGQAAVLLALLAGSLVEADAQRRGLRREIEQQRLIQARTDGELEAGRRIQLGILPTTASVAGDPRLDLAARMVPARQVGGDLYEFFKIDADHLLFAIGDVSGKGVPASLFMAVGKSLFKSCALRGEADIGAIVTRANQEISRENPELLFITVFAGLLDLNTGRLEFCNAGQDPPILLRTGEAPQLLATEPSPPLCAIEDFTYEIELVMLEPGDLLCLATDGVAEAMRIDGSQLGRVQAMALLDGVAADAPAIEVLTRLETGVSDFVDGAEPADDLTILALRWRGAIGQ